MHACVNLLFCSFTHASLLSCTQQVVCNQQKLRQRHKHLFMILHLQETSIGLHQQVATPDGNVQAMNGAML